MKYELVATATFGLEAVVRREVEALGFKVVKTEDGRVTYTPEDAGSISPTTASGSKNDSDTGSTNNDSSLWRAIAKSNLWLRSADRVYIKMGEFEAKTFEDLYQNVKSVAWEDFVPFDGRVVVVGTSVKSTLHSVPACQSITKKAIVDRLVNVYSDAGGQSSGDKIDTDQQSGDKQPAESPETGAITEALPETGATYTVRFAFMKDKCLLLMDTSGEGLHKRGYRVANVDAPIKETLAAALVQLSFWREGRILVDPCCGSGTIGIEAALIGLNIAPGLNRHFASEEWTMTSLEEQRAAGDSKNDADLSLGNIWKEERKLAYSQIRTDVELDITCSDINPKAIAAAKQNAEEAGVDDQIEFIVGDMAALPRKQKASGEEGRTLPDDKSIPAEADGLLPDSKIPAEGIIICNPPYGERIGEQKEIEHIYNLLREFYRDNTSWSLFMITADKDAENKVMGQAADRRRKLYNGMIETTYYQFHGERPRTKK